MAKIKLNKVEAACRQIDAAIRMLFDNEDPVAIHTLAMAGFRILRDLAAARSDSYMHNVAQSIIKPGMEGAFWGEMQSFANFLKHADQDPDAIFDNVDEEVNDITLMIASMYYQDLGNQFTPEMVALVSWYSAIRPDFLRSDAPEAFRQLLLTVAKTVADHPRHEQLALGKEVLSLAKTLPRR